MGARQSKRSVDITTTPKKGEGEVSAVGEEKIEKLADSDVKAVVTNGTAAHTDIEFADKDDEIKDVDDKPTLPEIKENGLPESSDGEKTPDKEAAGTAAAGDQSVKPEETPVVVGEKTPENGEKIAAETPDPKKQKEKKKKKWSLRSISFSKKDKSKPGKEKEKNGEVEEVNEEKAEEAVTSPTEESPKTEEPKTPIEEASKSVANGDASKEELVEKVPEAVAEADKEKPKTPEEPAPTPAVEAPKEEPKPEPAKIEECVKPVVEVPKPIAEETPAAPPTVEEVKEVRSEEVPPPLPSSNPPSQVTVFAESTKDNVLDVSEISVSQKSDISTVQSPVPADQAKPLDEPPKPAEPTPSESSSVTSAVAPPVSSSESVPSTVEVPPVALQAEPVLPAPVESKEEVKVEQKENVIVEPIAPVESSAVVVESVSKSPVEVSPKVETENKENLEVKFEQMSLQSEGVISVDSVPSLMTEEKIPIVSSAGDVPNALNYQPSVESVDNSLQELKSNQNLKESSSVNSEKSSTASTVDSSTKPEAESRDVNTDSLPKSPSVTSDMQPLESTSPKVESSSPILAQKDPESIVNPAESLPDLSTESLPSLPEPTDSLLEPMSLPPLDSVPDPLVDDSVPVVLSPVAKVESPLTQTPADTTTEQPPVVLTNGNATNGLKSSPIDETPLPPPLDGPLKQIVAPEPIVGDACDNSQTTATATAESVESPPAAAAQ